MSMTKKDYELIAESLRTTKDWGKDFQVYSNGAWVANSSFTILCENLANLLNRDNPRFNRDRFLSACGVRGVSESK